MTTGAGPDPKPRESRVLEAAYRLDNDKSMLVRMVGLISRIGARAVREHPGGGAGPDPAHRAPSSSPSTTSPTPTRWSPARGSPWRCAAGASTGWARGSCSRGRSSAGWRRTAASTRSSVSAADVEAFRLATRILEAGNVLLVFPEGTRSPDGRLQEAKDGLAMLAMRTGAQILPIGVNNSDAVWKKGQKLPSPFPRRTITVRIGEPFRVADVVPAGADRRTAKALGDDGDHGPHRRAAGPAPPRRVRGGVRHGPTSPERLSRRAPCAEGRDSPDVCEHPTAMGMVQEVRIANRTGFCYGVREAIDKAKESAAAGKRTHTLGQVVHNEGVIRDLEQYGVRSVDSLDDVDHGSAVVIRAHGVEPEVFERAEARGLEVIDGTCTWVIQEQRQLQELVDEGYTIVLLGHAQAPRGRGPAGLRPGRDRRRRGGGLGPDPAPQADGADHPVHPAAVEVREAGGVHGAAGRTSSRSSTPSARSRSGARRTPSRPPARWISWSSSAGATPRTPRS